MIAIVLERLRVQRHPACTGDDERQQRRGDRVHLACGFEITDHIAWWHHP